MSRELRVGIVGFGGAGLAQYSHFQALKGCKVVAVCDPKQPGLDRARQLSNTLFLTDDFDKLLSDDLEVVAVCSPDRTHADYMVKSLKAGKHTICEKPLTDSLEGCGRILQAQREAPGCVAAVQHQMRFLPLFIRMKELIRSGQLGKISYVEGYYVHNLTRRARLYDHWRFEDNATPLVYSGCHFVDLLRWLLDDEVVEVMGMANNLAFPEYPESDLNVILLRFRSGIIGKVITAFGAGRPQDHSVRVYGSDKCIENNLLFDKDGNFSVFARPGVQRIRRRHGLKAAVIGKLFEQLMKAYVEIGSYSLSYSIQSYPIRLYEHSFAVASSIAEFVRAIHTGEEPRCTVLDAAKTVATCLAGVEAYRTGRAVSMTDYWILEFGALQPVTHR
jgi:predicted dehydrogenase